MTSRVLLSTAFLLSILSLPGPANAGQDPLAGIRAEIAELRAEVARLRAELEAVRGTGQPGQEPAPGTLPPPISVPPIGAPAPGAPPAQPPADLDLLRTQVSELAQVKVASESRLPVRIFGTVHAHAFANSAEANWLDLPNLVAPDPAAGPSGTFNAGLRQTRLGIAIDGPTLGGVRASGNIAMDFFGGIPGFQTGQVMGLPRLLVAYARLDGERTAFEAGQDQMMLAPRDPTSLAAFSFPSFFRSGNLYLRVPQVRVERSITPTVRVMGGIVSPIAGDVPDETFRFVPPALGGERSRQPAYQAHVGYASDEPDARRLLAVGVSGHYGRERRTATREDESWAGALDFAWRYERIGIAGEAFTGENLDAFGGGLGLNARAAGGWAELQLFPTDRLSLFAGYGLDELGDVRTVVPRRRNRTASGTVIFALSPEIDAAVEYRWLETTPGRGEARRNHHVDWVFVHRF